MANNDRLPHIDLITDLTRLPEFNNDFNQNPPPSPCAQLHNINNMGPMERGLTFFEFLGLVNANSNLWETTSGGQLLGFSFYGGRMFLDLARVMVGHHVNHHGFVGDLLGRVRIHQNPGGQLLAEMPFDPIKVSRTNPRMLRDGIVCDVSHFRRMVALLIMRCFPMPVQGYQNYYNDLLTMPFNLFFSGIFTDNFCHYSMFQFFHPVFYNSEDRFKFIQIVENFKSVRHDNNYYSHLILREGNNRYGFDNWWHSITYAPLQRVYNYGGALNFRYRDANGLPNYIKCVHHRYQQSTHYSHKVADQYMHSWWPGYASKILDAIIRSFHNRWTLLPRPLKYYMIQPPFGFEIIR